MAPVQHLRTIYSLSGMCYLGKWWVPLPPRKACLPKDIHSSLACPPPPPPLKKKRLNSHFPPILSPSVPFPSPTDVGNALFPQLLILYYFRGFQTSGLVDRWYGLEEGWREGEWEGGGGEERGGEGRTKGLDSFPWPWHWLDAGSHSIPCKTSREQRGKF